MKVDMLILQCDVGWARLAFSLPRMISGVQGFLLMVSVIVWSRVM